MVKTAWASITFLNGSQRLNDVVDGVFPCSWALVVRGSLSNGFDLRLAAPAKLRAVLPP
jgi:hypothetical protein